MDERNEAAPDKVSAFALKLWARLNERRCHLIERNHAGVASDAERIELAQLQTLADECIQVFAPLPIAELEAYMKSKGIDVSNELSARDCPTCDDDAEDCMFNPPAPDELAHELPYVSGMVDRIRELEARLEAIDAALDDADAPEATEAHALDDDPIVERIKLWRHVDNEMAAQLADYPFLKQELERLRASIGPQTCDIHAAFSAGCLNCRLAQRDAQLAEANARAETAERRAEDADFNSGCEIKEKMQLRDTLRDCWDQFAITRPDGTKWAGGLSVLEEVERVLALNPRGEGEG